MLILLFKVLFQENLPSILILDEPEISLHLSWQFRLIEILQKLNPNCQLVIATHAPGILKKGWRDKAQDISDLVSSTDSTLSSSGSGFTNEKLGKK